MKKITYTTKPLFGFYYLIHQDGAYPSRTIYFNSNHKIYLIDKLEEIEMDTIALKNLWKKNKIYFVKITSEPSLVYLKERIKYLDPIGYKRLNINVIKNPNSIKNPVLDQVRTYGEKSKYGSYAEYLFKDANIKLLNVSKIAEVFIIESDYPITFKIPLKKGKYILKIYNDKHQLEENQTKYLMKLSSYRLIPRLIFIDHELYVQEYIPFSTDLQKILEENRLLHKTPKALYKYIFQRVQKELLRWHKLGFSHRDIHPRNILITNRGHIYLIDPKENNYGIDGFVEDGMAMQDLKKILIK